MLQQSVLKLQLNICLDAGSGHICGLALCVCCSETSGRRLRKYKKNRLNYSILSCLFMWWSILNFIDTEEKVTLFLAVVN